MAASLVEAFELRHNTRMQISEFKKQFNQNSPYTHLNNSGQAPIPEVNRQKVIEWLSRFYSEGAFCSAAGWAETDKVRANLARFIRAETEEIAFFQTTASAAVYSGARRLAVDQLWHFPKSTADHCF